MGFYNKKNSIPKRSVNNLYTLAPVLIFALSALYSSLCFMINITNMALPVIGAVLAVALVGIVFDRRILISCIITVALSVLCCTVAGRIYDFSFDGMSFHKEAVYALANGWNPLKTPLADFDPLANTSNLHLWLDNYPKGVWAFYAGVYRIFGTLESAKGVNVIFVLMLFFTAYDTIKTVFGFKKCTSSMLALVFTVNPVILSQFFTFMNDLPTAAVVMVCAFLGMKIYAKKADNIDYVCLIAVFASSFTVKFTAPVFCGITLLVFGVATAVKNRGRKLLKPCTIVILSALIGVLVLGADPYVKHMSQGIHSVYPVMGEGKYDIMNTNRPYGFDEMSGTRQLMVSLFSESSPNPGDVPKLKIPFTIHKDELEAVKSPDTRLGGFGVLFSGILLICMTLGAIALLKAKNVFAMVPALLAFVLMALFFPESWWARYNPYVYYIPCLMLMAFSSIPKTKIISLLVSALFIVNSMISAVSVANYFIGETKVVEDKLQEIRDENKTTGIRINDFTSHHVWFGEKGIDFELELNPVDETWQIFYGTTKYKYR